MLSNFSAINKVSCCLSLSSNGKEYSLTQLVQASNTHIVPECVLQDNNEPNWIGSIPRSGHNIIKRDKYKGRATIMNIRFQLGNKGKVQYDNMINGKYYKFKPSITTEFLIRFDSQRNYMCVPTSGESLCYLNLINCTYIAKVIERLGLQSDTRLTLETTEEVYKNHFLYSLFYREGLSVCQKTLAYMNLNIQFRGFFPIVVISNMIQANVQINDPDREVHGLQERLNLLKIRSEINAGYAADKKKAQQYEADRLVREKVQRKKIYKGKHSGVKKGMIQYYDNEWSYRFKAVQPDDNNNYLPQVEKLVHPSKYTCYKLTMNKIEIGKIWITPLNTWQELYHGGLFGMNNQLDVEEDGDHRVQINENNNTYTTKDGTRYKKLDNQGLSIRSKCGLLPLIWICSQSFQDDQEFLYLLDYFVGQINSQPAVLAALIQAMTPYFNGLVKYHLQNGSFKVSNPFLAMFRNKIQAAVNDWTNDQGVALADMQSLCNASRVGYLKCLTSGKYFYDNFARKMPYFIKLQQQHFCLYYRTDQYETVTYQGEQCLVSPIRKISFIAYTYYAQNVQNISKKEPELNPIVEQQSIPVQFYRYHKDEQSVVTYERISAYDASYPEWCKKYLQVSAEVQQQQDAAQQLRQVQQQAREEEKAVEEHKQQQVLHQQAQGYDCDEYEDYENEEDYDEEEVEVLNTQEDIDRVLDLWSHYQQLLADGKQIQGQGEILEQLQAIRANDSEVARTINSLNEALEQLYYPDEQGTLLEYLQQTFGAPNDYINALAGLKECIYIIIQEDVVEWEEMLVCQTDNDVEFVSAEGTSVKIPKCKKMMSQNIFWKDKVLCLVMFPIFRKEEIMNVYNERLDTAIKQAINNYSQVNYNSNPQPTFVQSIISYLHQRKDMGTVNFEAISEKIAARIEAIRISNSIRYTGLQAELIQAHILKTYGCVIEPKCEKSELIQKLTDAIKDAEIIEFNPATDEPKNFSFNGIITSDIKGSIQKSIIIHNNIRKYNLKESSKLLAEETEQLYNYLWLRKKGNPLGYIERNIRFMLKLFGSGIVITLVQKVLKMWMNPYWQQILNFLIKIPNIVNVLNSWGLPSFARIISCILGFFSLLYNYRNSISVAVCVGFMSYEIVYGAYLRWKYSCDPVIPMSNYQWLYLRPNFKTINIDTRYRLGKIAYSQFLNDSQIPVFHHLIPAARGKGEFNNLQDLDTLLGTQFPHVLQPEEVLEKQLKKDAKIEKQSCPSINQKSIAVKDVYNFSKAQHATCYKKVKYWNVAGKEITKEELYQFLQEDKILKKSEHKNKKVYLPGIPFVDHVSANLEGKEFNVDAYPKIVQQTDINLLNGIIQRHGGHFVVPDPRVFSDFKRIVQPKINKLIEKIKRSIALQDTITITQYIKHFPRSKAKMYARLARRNKLHGMAETIKLKVLMMLKKDEYVYAPDNKVRPRIIANPDDNLKLYGGWINHHILQALRKCRWFVQGYNTHETADLIYQSTKHIQDGVWLSWDGSAHDSSQHEELRQFVDNQILNAILPQLYLKLNISGGLAQELTKALTATTFNFEAKYGMKSKGPNMMTGQIVGTVLSGHPTQTTTFNTVRVYLMVWYICQKMKIPRNVWKGFVAGDDMLLRISKCYVLRFISIMKTLFANSNSPQMHGLGYVIKEMNIHPVYFTFLSKVGSINSSGVQIGRQIDRLIKGGNICETIGTKISRDDYNIGMCAQLRDQSQHSQIALAYIAAREKLIQKKKSKEDTKKIVKYLNEKQYNNHTTNPDAYWMADADIMFMQRRDQSIHEYSNDPRFYRGLGNIGVDLDGPDYKMFISYVTKAFGLEVIK